MLDTLQLIVKTYTRAFVAQSVGIIGLLWCLYDDHVGFGGVLTALVLVDQAIFLRSRFVERHEDFPLRLPLDLWCVAISLVDVLILFALLFQSVGLHDMARNTAVSDPLDFLAFSLAAFARLGSGLVADTGAARLLAGVEALLGYGVAFGILAAILAAIIRRQSKPAIYYAPVAPNQPRLRHSDADEDEAWPYEGNDPRNPQGL